MLMLEYLAAKRRAVSMSRLVNEIGLPRRFSAQIAASLVKEGILASREGVSGGYILSKPLKKIKLYDLLRIFEGDLKLTKCSDDNFKCSWERLCRHHNFWKTKLTGKFIQLINGLTVADLIHPKENA